MKISKETIHIIELSDYEKSVLHVLLKEFMDLPGPVVDENFKSFKNADKAMRTVEEITQELY